MPNTEKGLVDEKTIWQSKQNHPELVVQDCKMEFGLNAEQCERLRFILLNRGINKWLYARRLFIKLKDNIGKLRKYYKFPVISAINTYGQIP